MINLRGVLKPCKFCLIIVICSIIITLLSNLLKRFELGDSYFWTLSSIVQGFAALVGILFVIMIFQFQNISNEKNRLIHEIDYENHIIGDMVEYRQDLEFLNDRGLLNYLNELSKKIENVNLLQDKTRLNGGIISIKNLLEMKQKFKDKFLFPIALSFSTILLGIIGLAFFSIFNNSQVLWVIILISLFMASVSLFEIIHFIRDVLISD